MIIQRKIARYYTLFRPKHSYFTSKNGETKSKIKDRMNRIFTEATTVDFAKVNSDSFARNMMLIDSRLSELVDYSLIYHYRDGISTCKEVVEKMENDNLMNYPTDGFYEYKYKKLLCSAALGMTLAKNGMELTKLMVDT